MSLEQKKIHVYYDGACPQCIRDRDNYEKLAGKAGQDVCWIDITGKDEELRLIGIDPKKALKELHVKDEHDIILREIDAYIVLMGRVPLLRPIAWFIGLPVIRPVISRVYRWQVDGRLRRENRL